MAAAIPPPPPARVDNVTDTLHGVAISDPYRWLEDQNSPETRAWLDAQMAYTHSILEKIPGRDRIRARLDRYTRLETSSVPIVAGGHYFFTRREADENQAKLYVADGPNNPPRVLVDPAPLSSDESTAVSLLDVARDGKWIAYGLRRGGEDETTMTFLKIGRGQGAGRPFPPWPLFRCQYLSRSPPALLLHILLSRPPRLPPPLWRRSQIRHRDLRQGIWQGLHHRSPSLRRRPLSDLPCQ